MFYVPHIPLLLLGFLLSVKGTVSPSQITLSLSLHRPVLSADRPRFTLFLLVFLPSLLCV